MGDAGELADQYAALFNERGTPITAADLERAAAHIRVGGQRSDMGPSLFITVERLAIKVDRLADALDAIADRVQALERPEVVGD